MSIWPTKVRRKLHLDCLFTDRDRLAGWVALHHAALVAPPTLVSHLLTRGSSPFALTRRQLTALDIVTGRTTLPGREQVALLLAEAMREKGWTGGRMEDKRRISEKRLYRHRRRKELQENVGKVLGVNSRWWGDVDAEFMYDLFDEDEDEDMGEHDIFVSICILSLCRLSHKVPMYRRLHQIILQCLSSHHMLFLTSSSL